MEKIIASARAVNTGETYTTAITAGRHSLVADESVSAYGHDMGPAPGDYLCMALASCTAITLRMYVLRKGWKIDEISVTAVLAKGSDLASGNNTFHCDVAWKGSLDAEQEKRLMDIAKACPVHRLLTKPSDVVTVAADKRS